MASEKGFDINDSEPTLVVSGQFSSECYKEETRNSPRAQLIKKSNDVFGVSQDAV